MPETWYAVELLTTDGVAFHAICKSTDELVNHVRVNASDMATMKISAVEPSILAQNRIAETFDE